VCRGAGAPALIRNPHEPVDDLGSLANGKAGGRDTQRNGAQIDIGRQTPVQLDLGAAGDSRLLNRAEVETRKTDGLLEFQDNTVSQEYPRHRGFTQLNLPEDAS
jgi:hypothetical protein